MGGIIEVRMKLGAGNIQVIGNDKIEIEKNDEVLKVFNVYDISYRHAAIYFDGVQFMATVDWDVLTPAQKDAIMNNPNIQVIKKFGTP